MISEIRFEKFGETNGWTTIWDILKAIIYAKKGRDIEIDWEAILGKRKSNSKGLFNKDSTGGLVTVAKGLIPNIKKENNIQKRINGFILKRN